jgi:hypothetical protein
MVPDAPAGRRLLAHTPQGPKAQCRRQTPDAWAGTGG